MAMACWYDFVTNVMIAAGERIKRLIL